MVSVQVREGTGSVRQTMRHPHIIVGESEPIRHIRHLVQQLGLTRASVLLLGETGVGKEVVARAIYDHNPEGNFVPIDCACLVGPLMENELFGHEKGAYTGAGENKRGLIDLANRGTAFFDEIGDLPADLQAKLLRLLQEREYRPVGSLVSRKADFRVIAATHRDLQAEVADATFRQDLYYRLNIIEVTIPPLRERKEDILCLSKHYLARLDEKVCAVR